MPRNAVTPRYVPSPLGERKNAKNQRSTDKLSEKCSSAVSKYQHLIKEKYYSSQVPSAKKDQAINITRHTLDEKVSNDYCSKPPSEYSRPQSVNSNKHNFQSTNSKKPQLIDPEIIAQKLLLEPEFITQKLLEPEVIPQIQPVEPTVEEEGQHKRPIDLIKTVC